MKKSIFILLILLLVVSGGLFLLSRNLVPKSAQEHIQDENILLFKVEPETQSCVGVGPMDCLVINGEFFYDQIEGFKFEPGYSYELKVERAQQANVPADASKYTYKLLEIVSKVPNPKE